MNLNPRPDARLMRFAHNVRGPRPQIIGRERLVKNDDGAQRPSEPDEADERAEEEEVERVIRCAECGGVLTRPKHRIAVGGRHDHVFTNPHGYVFHIACFREAEGAAGVGEESDEWAWFPGHVWQTAMCRGCMTHIGWAFRQGASEFWGLIAAKLTE